MRSRERSKNCFWVSGGNVVVVVVLAGSKKYPSPRVNSNNNHERQDCEHRAAKADSIIHRVLLCVCVFLQGKSCF
jgi:uncharacterized membrane protein